MHTVNRGFVTVLWLGSFMLFARVATAGHDRHRPEPQLVVSSATFDATNNQLVIRGQHFSWPPKRASMRGVSPHVTLDLLPLTVISATATEIVASLSGTFPEGTYLLTVSRGSGPTDTAAFAVAISHGSAPQVIEGPAGPAGPPGPPGAIGPQGLPGVSNHQVVSASASIGNLGPGQLISGRAACPAGMRVLGGGVRNTSTSTFAVTLSLVSSYPDTEQSWSAEFRNNQAFSMGAVALVIYATCATVN